MNAAPATATDVYSAFGAPAQLPAGASGSLIATGMQAGLADRARRELFGTWAASQVVPGLGGSTVSLVVAGRGGERCWIEPDPAGPALVRLGADWRVVDREHLPTPGADASMAPARSRTAIAGAPPGTDIDAAAGELLLLAVAALAVGTAARSLVAAVAHAGQREQFGRPIGSFQAVSHRLASSFRDLVSAQELLFHAEAIDAAAEHRALVMALARHRALRAATAAVGTSVQTFAAEGFQFDSTAGIAFRQVQEDRLASRLSRHERSTHRPVLVDALGAIRRP